MSDKNVKNMPLAIVTGGTSGIGLAISQALVKNGYFVIAASIDSKLTIKQIEFKSFQWVRTDVRSEHQVAKLFLRSEKTNLDLKVLVNCAGVGVFKNIPEISSQEWKKVIDTNLTGAFFCSKMAFDKMRLRGGRMIHIGSVCDHIGLPMNAAYASSKFGLRGLSQVINEEGKEFGIRSTLVSLGAVYTDIWSNRKEFNKNDMLSVNDVSQTIIDIISKRENVRIDEVKIFPSKGIL